MTALVERRMLVCSQPALLTPAPGIDIKYDEIYCNFNNNECENCNLNNNECENNLPFTQVTVHITASSQVHFVIGLQMCIE